MEMMQLQISPYALETIIRFRETMLFLDLTYRQERGLDKFHSRLCDRLAQHQDGVELLRGLLTNESRPTVTVEIGPYDINHYSTLADEVSEPFPMYNTRPESYHNDIFEEWRKVTDSWEDQMPNRHLHKKNTDPV